VFEAKYTVLGRVTEGLDIVEKIAAGGVAEGGSSPTDGKPKVDVTIQTLTVSEPDAEPAASTQPSGAATSPTPAPSQ
jgi:peptidyl-prolyl cis-trans isomerase B (cyclophilin B)